MGSLPKVEALLSTDTFSAEVLSVIADLSKEELESCAKQLGIPDVGKTTQKKLQAAVGGYLFDRTTKGKGAAPAPTANSELTVEFKKVVASLVDVQATLATVVSQMAVKSDEMVAQNVAIEDLKREVASLHARLNASQSNRAPSSLSLSQQVTEVQERESRKLNLRVDGLAEGDGETQEQLLCKVEDLLKTKIRVNLPKGAVVSVRRQGGRKPLAGAGTSRQRPSTVVVQVDSLATKQVILKGKKNLGGRASQLAVNEDLTQMQRDNIRDLLPKMKEARAAGKYAFFRGDELVVLEPRNPARARSPTASPRPQGGN
jgi:hypothetical protein